MNICDYIKKNNIPHQVLPDGRIKQVSALDLSASNITSLCGFVQRGWLYLRGNEISSLEGFVQNGYLDLSYNQITSLDGFEQNGTLDLAHNQITSLNGFVQNGPLDLTSNQITSLNGFVHNNYLDVSYNWIISLEGFMLSSNFVVHMSGNSIYKILKQSNRSGTILYNNGKIYLFSAHRLSNVHTEYLIIRNEYM
jgi:Leucine-rich repeat (LRR) protein